MLIGGKGGGRPTMARAGGKQPERLEDAVALAEKTIIEALALDEGHRPRLRRRADRRRDLRRNRNACPAAHRVERAASEAGLRELAALVAAEGAERIVVGLPLTLRGEEGLQANETALFVDALRAAVDVPVESFDERFTTTLAAAGPSSRAPEDARAAAHLLESYLTWTSRA